MRWLWWLKLRTPYDWMIFKWTELPCYRSVWPHTFLSPLLAALTASTVLNRSFHYTIKYQISRHVLLKTLSLSCCCLIKRDDEGSVPSPGFFNTSCIMKGRFGNIPDGQHHNTWELTGVMCQVNEYLVVKLIMWSFFTGFLDHINSRSENIRSHIVHTVWSKPTVGLHVDQHYMNPKLREKLIQYKQDNVLSLNVPLHFPSMLPNNIFVIQVGYRNSS